MKCIFEQFLSATTIPSVALVSAPRTMPSCRKGELFPKPQPPQGPSRGQLGGLGMGPGTPGVTQQRGASASGPACPPASLTLKMTPAMVVPVLRGAGTRSPFWTSSASRCEFLQHRGRVGPGGRLPPPPPPPPGPARPGPAAPRSPGPGPLPPPHRAQLSKLKPPAGARSTDTAAMFRRARAGPRALPGQRNGGGAAR